MINRKFIFLIISIITLTPAFAQDHRIEIGVEVSPGMTSLRGNPLVDRHDATLGFTGGFFLQYNFSNLFSLRTNLALERKGSSNTSQVTDQNGNIMDDMTLHFNFNYLVLPILTRASFGQRAKFFIDAGPYLGYLLKNTAVLKGENYETTRSHDDSLYKKADFGLSTGAGVSIPLNKNISLSFEARNSLGLTNVSAVPVIADGSIKMNSLNLLVGLVFQLGNKNKEISEGNKKL